MLREKEMLIITFKTTVEAMDMEYHCKEQGLPGRLIPVPKAITAGCGMAWCIPPDQATVLESMMQHYHIHPEGQYICMV